MTFATSSRRISSCTPFPSCENDSSTSMCRRIQTMLWFPSTLTEAGTWGEPVENFN